MRARVSARERLHRSRAPEALDPKRHPEGEHPLWRTLRGSEVPPRAGCVRSRGRPCPATGGGRHRDRRARRQPERRAAAAGRFGAGLLCEERHGAAGRRLIRRGRPRWRLHFRALHRGLLASRGRAHGGAGHSLGRPHTPLGGPRDTPRDGRESRRPGTPATARGATSVRGGRGTPGRAQGGGASGHGWWGGLETSQCFERWRPQGFLGDGGGKAEVGPRRGSAREAVSLEQGPRRSRAGFNCCRCCCRCCF
mmetsp:Transcript_65401/g.147550  ORF Transcript_65401/g.147550 Transcript_65401/m.147550 type:complete len:252 (-) Transcript_65401:1067-1822(-)